jgi:SAM-dependent methyltransferase
LFKKRHERHPGYVNIFDDLGTDWEAIVNERDTENEADFIQDTAAKKGPVLDLCCGTGRHIVALSKRGCNVTGMDVSRKLLAIAKLRMARAKVQVPLVRADMRFFPFRDGVFATILNMFTSFGYLPSESEDALCLLEINRTLKGKGRFLLDLANRDHIIKGFRERDWAEFKPYYLLEKRSLDIKASKLSSQWTLIRKKTGRTKSIRHSVRLYTYARLEQLLNEAGLAVEHAYGGYEGQDFTLETSRMIIIAQKSP